MNASSSMHSRLAVRQELGSDVGSASITPIDPTRPSAAERPTRSMLGGKRGEIGGVIEPRIHLSQAAELSRKAGPPLTTASGIWVPSISAFTRVFDTLCAGTTVLRITPPSD